MSIFKGNVSRAWIESVFNSPPRRDIDKESKSTTRFPVFIGDGIPEMYGEGRNEFVALLSIRHLQSLGIVHRFKAQPFALEEIGGPKRRVPDILVELHDLSLHVVQVKAKRFLTPEVEAAFREEKQILEPLGFSYHVWTDRDKTGRPISQSAQLLDRGFRHPAPLETFEAIRQRAIKASRLGDLLLEFGWDNSMAAAAHQAFHIDLTENIHEDSPISVHRPTHYESYFFGRRNIPHGWWDSLPA